MSFRKELEKRRAAKKEIAEREAKQRQHAQNQMEDRADELLEHIEAEGAHSLGIIIKKEDTRILLQHPNSPNAVRVDVDVNTYSLDIVSPTPKDRPFSDTVPGAPHMSVKSLKQVDAYILDFLESIDALDQR